MKTKEQELVIKVQKFNDVKSYDLLRVKYKNLINNESYVAKRKFPHIPLEVEDIRNVITYHFYKIIIEYNPEKGMKFGVYAKINLRYAIMNHIRKLINKNNKVMNYKVDYVDEFTNLEKTEEQKNAEFYLEEITSSIDTYKFLRDVEKKYIKEIVENNITDAKEISEKLGIPLSTIYDIRKRIAKKLKKHLGL